MPRFEPLGHSARAPEPGEQVVVRRGPDGKLQLAVPEQRPPEPPPAAPSEEDEPVE